MFPHTQDAPSYRRFIAELLIIASVLDMRTAPREVRTCESVSILEWLFSHLSIWNYRSPPDVMSPDCLSSRPSLRVSRSLTWVAVLIRIHRFDWPRSTTEGDLQQIQISFSLLDKGAWMYENTHTHTPAAWSSRRLRGGWTILFNDDKQLSHININEGRNGFCCRKPSHLFSTKDFAEQKTSTAREEELLRWRWMSSGLALP